MTADGDDELHEEPPQTDAAPPEEEWQVQTEGRDDERHLSDEERAALLIAQLKALRVVDVAHDMMLSLVTLGYQKLGLTDETRELRNLEDARLAIELLRGVMDVVGAATSEHMVAPFRSTLATMQLNFARVAAPPAVTDDAPAAEPIDKTPDTEAGEATPDAEPAETGEPKPASVSGEKGEPKPVAASGRRKRAAKGAAEDPKDVAGGESPADGGPDASDQGA